MVRVKWKWFANYIEVINARQFLLQAELASVNDHVQQLRGTVNLVAGDSIEVLK